MAMVRKFQIISNKISVVGMYTSGNYTQE